MDLQANQTGYEKNSLSIRHLAFGVVLTALVVGGFCWRVGLEKNNLNQEVITSQNKINEQEIISTSNNKNINEFANRNLKISLEMLPIAFELPQGHTLFQREGFEGGYTTTLSVGKNIHDGYIKYAPLEIELLHYVYDTKHQRSYKPSEYISVVFEDQQELYGNPRYIELLGNKAVRYSEDADESTTIIGYIRANQLPKISDEYLVRITSYTYGRGVEFDKYLFDTVVNTLQIID